MHGRSVTRIDYLYDGASLIGLEVIFRWRTRQKNAVSHHRLARLLTNEESWLSISMRRMCRNLENVTGILHGQNYL